ncbi:peptidoglycan DD-metalloendopeptidase family protein [uncultured Maribacter sp.]|uniref:peptidoglycan DD-metalloendopeptidase family protein n=1 Tax=uncultured Maribacter sp. TaxID=431308 RepID=UPI0026029510|nr:peptidoglycan DD-metalloendopeptidase family protein [uncultured Maribacter sp.]
MKRAFLFFTFILFFTFQTNAQTAYPQDTFRSPMDIPLILAGTFGELRSNHFHSGIDIKTKQREGLPIYGIGDGTITRIKVSLWGYGKVIYIAHPNGYTSVYGHLQKFSPKIESYIKKLQYQKKSYEVEVFPDYGDLKIEKGELIAYSGNTGSSGGPHLHFEIRSSATEKPTNPLLYGYKVDDATNPTLLKLFGYPLSTNAIVNKSNERIQLNFKKQKDGSFLADKVTAIGTIGFGFVGFDRQDMAANKNGIFSLEQIVNGKVYTEFDFEKFSFSESRYINTLIDYEFYSKYRQRIQKCFKTPSNRLSIYNKIKNNGKISVVEGLSYTVEIRLKDVEGNTTKLIIPVEGKKEELQKVKKALKTDYYVVAKKPNNFSAGPAKIYFPSNTFYEDFYMNLEHTNDTITFHNSSVPAHRNFTITFDASKYSKEEQKKLFIARLDSKLKPSHVTTYKRGNTFTTKTKYLGTYTIAKDTVAPKISPKNFKAKQWLNNYKYLSLKITDDFSGINTYSATINGEWVLMEYESKKNTITYNFEDKVLKEQKCNLKVLVTDNVGNTKEYTTTFYRK